MQVVMALEVKSRMGCKVETMVWTKDIRHHTSTQARRVSGVVERRHMAPHLTVRVVGINEHGRQWHSIVPKGTYGGVEEYQ